MNKTVKISETKTADYLTDTFITGSDRRSVPKLTKFEETSIIGFRAEQLANNAPTRLKELPIDIATDMMKIAEAEFREGLIDCKILRPVNRNGKKMHEVIVIGKESDVYIIPKA